MTAAQAVKNQRKTGRPLETRILIPPNTSLALKEQQLQIEQLKAENKTVTKDNATLKSEKRTPQGRTFSTGGPTGFPRSYAPCRINQSPEGEVSEVGAG